MAVAKGFKQTEAGVIPEDWECVNIGSLGEVRMCKRVFNHETAPIGEIPFYKISTFGKEPDAFISRDLYNSYRQKFSFPRKGDVLISAAGTIGRTVVYNGEDAYFQDSNIVWVENDEKRISNKLFSHVLKIVNYNTEGGTIQRLYNNILKNTAFPLPPKEEQEAIANALSDADALIESLEKLIAKKRLIKKGVMQELLTSDNTWRATNLLELCDGRKELFDDGDWIEAEHITNEGVRLIQTGNIGVGYFIDREEKKYIFETSFQKLKCKQLQAGDLLICRLADPAGRACILPELSENKVITSVDVTICRPSHKKADRRFLVQMFSTNEWLQAISERSGGTTHKRIARGALSQIEIKLPNVTTQARVADILSDMDTDISVLGQKLAKARLIKQGMMLELLTGRIRLI